MNINPAQSLCSSSATLYAIELLVVDGASCSCNPIGYEAEITKKDMDSNSSLDFRIHLIVFGRSSL